MTYPSYLDRTIADFYTDVLIAGRRWKEPVVTGRRATWHNGERGIQVETYGSMRVWRKIEDGKRYAISEPVKPETNKGPKLVALWDWMTGD